MTSPVTFTVTSTLNNSAGTNNNGYTFQITLNDPCPSITAPSSPAAKVFDIGGSDYTWTVPAWT